MSVLDINAHNDQACTGIETILVVSSAAGLQLSALTTQLWKHICIQNNEKCIDRRSNFVTTGK